MTLFRRKILASFFTAALSLGAIAQEFNHPSILSFEKETDLIWQTSKRGKVDLSQAHYKHGSSSLEWSWKKPGNLTLQKPIGFKPFDPSSADKSIPSFVVWVYNEKPVKDHVKFIFGTNEKEDCHFTFNLDYKGWRAAWVAFERDMKGTPRESMNFLRIEGPRSLTKGRLFFDHMMICTPIDSRHHTADHQVPFVNKETTNHWLILEKSSQKKPDIPIKTSLSKEEKQAFRVIEKRYFDAVISKQKVNKAYVNKLHKKYATFNISRSKEGVVGKPIWFGNNADVYKPLVQNPKIKKQIFKDGVNTRAYFDFLYKVASAYNNCQEPALKSQLEEMYLDLFDLMVDHGIASGSGLGTIHHYGYSWRSYYKALFIMKEVLLKTNRLEEAVQGMQWYSGLGEVLEKPQKAGMSMDALNTTVMGRMGSILIMKDSPRKAQLLACFSRWLDNGLHHANGLADALKLDGSAYHHCNNYPAYATGGFSGATQMVYLLNNTHFAVSQEAHATLKKSLLMMRLYCNLKEWPVSMSGRHPLKKGGSLQPNQFAILALAGSPDRKKEIDPELAQAFLRLSAFDKPGKYNRLFKKAGFKAEPTPQGSWTMPYSSINIQRRGEWSAVVRGHSRYLWAAEHYIGANYYGRYLAHGSLAIHANGSPAITREASGYSQPGWDWNRIPGTTSIHLPLDLLRANILNVDQFSGYEEMLYSDESFAGGLTMDQTNGVYAFKLHEHDKYEGSHRARKSYFFFDNRIICLGSDIENTQEKYPTETTLFQCHLKKDDNSIILDGENMTAFPYSKRVNTTNNWLLDNLGNGYFLPSGQKITIGKAHQDSRDQAKETPTSGNFASAVINHGRAPKNGAYEYVMLVQTNKSEMAAFSKDMLSKKSQPVQVLRKDATAHIVFDNATQTTGYAIFEANQKLEDNLVQTTNLPCLVMAKKEDKSLKLSLANPDLNLYQGPSDELIENGKRVERSIYSRPWIYNDSKPSFLEVTIKGSWQVAPKKGITCQPGENGTTILKVKCQHGLTNEIILQKL